MSFSKKIKHEISRNTLFECCQRSQLSALILMSSKLIINQDGISLQFATENTYIAKRVWQLAKDLFDANLKLDVMVNQSFEQNKTYQVNIIGNGLQVLSELGLYDENGLKEAITLDDLENECCERAFLAGAFMANGSVNSPNTTEYHLEISSDSEKLSNLVQALMNKLSLDAKVIMRRKQHVVYIKQAENISDLLRAIGSSNGVMEFEEARIQRDFVNNFTRLDNCELANEVKVLTAASKQLELIAKIEEHGLQSSLSPAHLEVIELRKQFPESSLNELTDEYYIMYGKTITKSGLNHRFKRIEEIIHGK
ncbi:MAG: DNA-binding protein WhiA [Erysipelothrix sp.]|nr:DNA-binding protein WhiA [Erysipelothrix sp.]